MALQLLNRGGLSGANLLSLFKLCLADGDVLTEDLVELFGPLQAELVQIDRAENI